MISPELHAQIRRLFFAEHWRVTRPPSGSAFSRMRAMSCWSRPRAWARR